MAILLVILKAASSYYYTILDHMTNIEILNKASYRNYLHSAALLYVFKKDPLYPVAGWLKTSGIESFDLSMQG